MYVLHINYDYCYTLHTEVKFVVNLDEKNMASHEKTYLPLFLML